jgi:hypothetical protein
MGYMKAIINVNVQKPYIFFTALFTILFYPAEASNYSFFAFNNLVDFNSLNFYSAALLF